MEEGLTFREDFGKRTEWVGLGGGGGGGANATMKS